MGLSGAASDTFYSADFNDHTPPVVTLGAADCLDVTRSVSDAGPVYYGLYSREQGGDGWTALEYGHSDDGSVTGELGLFDPTLIRNGVYEIILYARDLNGNYALDQGCVLVDGGMKLGVVNLPAQDMSVPAPGFPLGLEREYDSRDAGPGDFGPGWNLPSSNVKAMTTQSLSGGWSQEAIGGLLTTYVLLEMRRHVVVLRLSDEEVLKFKMEVTPKTSQVIPYDPLKPVFIKASCKRIEI